MIDDNQAEVLPPDLFFVKAGGIELIGLSVAIAALSGSYIFLRHSAKKDKA